MLAVVVVIIGRIQPAKRSRKNDVDSKIITDYLIVDLYNTHVDNFGVKPSQMKYKWKFDFVFSPL